MAGFVLTSGDVTVVNSGYGDDAVIVSIHERGGMVVLQVSSKQFAVEPPAIELTPKDAMGVSKMIRAEAIKALEN